MRAPLAALRGSFATKLLLGGILLTLILVGAVGGYLIYSRDQQTTTGALSNSDNRAGVMRQVLEQFTGKESFATAQGLSGQGPLIDALSGSNPGPAVAQLFKNSPVDLSGEVLLIADRTGSAVYVRPASDLTVGSDLDPFESPLLVSYALNGQRCALTGQAGACGVDLLSGGIPAYAVAVPVVSASGTTVGVVAYIAPLQQQLQRFTTLFQFPTAFVAVSNPDTEIRLNSTTPVTTRTPPAIAAAVRTGKDVVHSTYTAPVATGGLGQVAGSFAAELGADGRTVVGYVGVEVPVAPFVGDEHTDVLTIIVITAFALLLIAALIIIFVESVVRRPIRRLERGVARIAGGDYNTPIPVRGHDELARLASSVNRMGESIARYTTQLKDARQRLDRAVERVSGMSSALTTTTGGVAALQNEVVRAAAGIVGQGSKALFLLREGDQLVVQAIYGDRRFPSDLSRWDRFPSVLRGDIVRESQPGEGSLLAMPMFFQGEVLGALALLMPAGAQVPAEDQEKVLVVLANNAAIAMENARLFEQEKETVQRLRQLDAMKSDFLSTVQHELRTPLTAILGLSDLIEMCWETWEDQPKLDVIHDIQLAARNLYDIVETIIDFNAVEGETVVVHPTQMPLRDAVDRGVTGVAERHKGGLPVPVDIDVPAGQFIQADPDRFEQVLRALIDNAVKFSDGHGRVLVRAVPSPRFDFVRLDVVDQGIGIPPDDLPRVFERFFQVDNTATRRYGGTGMGLALVKRLVTAHGATIEVESKLGFGTRVVLDWPASEAALRAASPRNGSPNGNAMAASLPPAAVS
ncbi:MAG: HAMP domain-containing protein [Candidatus Dormibacteraeota bacterium]|nr:HAMP domain-containing protein [Candidatus Dormibacteraeota bacterium]